MIGKDLRKTIDLNVLYVKEIKIYPTYVSNHNFKSEKQVILLLIPNGEKWHYLAIKNINLIKRNIIKICREFLLFESCSVF